MATAAPNKEASRSHAIFISYSRKDKEFVRRLDDELARRGREAWVDWEGIRPTEEFMQAIYGAIEGADTFVFVLTPDSVASEVCGHEIAHAAAHNKRMVPIVAREVDADAVPEPLAKLNWIFSRPGDDFEAAAGLLVSALDTDLEWVHAHTRLLTRAIEWEAKEKSNSFVLRGEDLRSAEQWLAQAGSDKERQPTALQTEYIIASRKAAARRQRITLGAVSFGAVVAVVLAIAALMARNRATLARDEAGKLIQFMTFDLQEKLKPIGRLDLLDDVNRRVRAFYDSFPGEDQSPELLRQRGVLLDNQGDVARAQGDLGVALRSYRDAHAIFEQLSRQDPDNAYKQRDLSISSSEVGNVQMVQGDLAGALQSYRDSLVISEKLAKRDSKNATWQRDLSIDYEFVGNVQLAQGDLAGALKTRLDRLAIAEKLAKRDPGNVGWQRDLSVSYEHVGDVQHLQGDLAAALKSQRNSLSIREALVKEDPGHAGWRHDLAVSHGFVASVLRAQGDLVGALQSYRDSVAIDETLAKQDPSNAGWRSGLSYSYDKIGAVQSAQGDFRGALESYNDSLTIRETLAEQDPANASWQLDLSSSYDNIGDVLRAQGLFAEALRSYRASLALR